MVASLYLISSYVQKYTSSTKFISADSTADIPDKLYIGCPYPAGSIFKCGNEYYKLASIQTSEEISCEMYAYSASTLAISVRDELGSTIDNRDAVGMNNVDPITVTYANKITRRLYLEPIDNKAVCVKNSFKISSTRNTCGAYDIIATPYKTPEDVGIKIDGIYQDPTNSLNLFQTMTATWSDQVVYDIQVLPYCPIKQLSNVSITTVFGLNKDVDYTPYYDETSAITGYIFYGSSADINFNIAYNIPAITTKTDYICKKYRLNAPNFGSSYDIPVAQNWGVDEFNISMTPLPYSPWIKISPVFKGLNGANYNDSRGLIINGSLQITQITDAFAQYQYSNSNYQSIFDRQIENSEKLYSIQKTQNIISGAANVVSAGINGAAAGALVGGPVGAGVGAVARYSIFCSRTWC